MADRKILVRVWAGGLVLIIAISLGYAIRRIRVANRPVHSEPAAKVEIDEQQRTYTANVRPAPVAEQVRDTDQTAITRKNAARDKKVSAEPVEAATEQISPESQEPHEYPTEPEALIRRVLDELDLTRFIDELDLTEQEQERFDRGFQLVVQEFENLSPQEQRVQTDRMRRMVQQWEQMSDARRQAVIENMRQKYEQWRRSNSIALPEPTLDID